MIQSGFHIVKLLRHESAGLSGLKVRVFWCEQMPENNLSYDLVYFLVSNPELATKLWEAQDNRKRRSALNGSTYLANFTCQIWPRGYKIPSSSDMIEDNTNNKISILNLSLCNRIFSKSVDPLSIVLLSLPWQYLAFVLVYWSRRSSPS